MDPVSATIIIDAPRERVHELLIDLAARPAFTDHFMSEYRIERIPAKGVGAAARFRTGAGLDRIWMETVIVGAEAEHRIEERGRGGRNNRIPIFTSWELTVASGDNTKVTVSFWTEPSLRSDRMRELGARSWYRRKLKRALRRLRALAESGEPAERVRVAGRDRVPIT